MKFNTHTPFESTHRKQAFTLIESLFTLAISALAISGIVSGYLFAFRLNARSAEYWAAHSLANQRIEQTYSAKWDTFSVPPIDEVIPSNFPEIKDSLDLPVHNGVTVDVTITTQITDIDEEPPSKLIKVDVTEDNQDKDPIAITIQFYRLPNQ